MPIAVVNHRIHLNILNYNEMKLLFTLFVTSSFFLSFQGCSIKTTSAPILILATSENFGTYTAEMLKTEGFNEFVVEAPDSKSLNKSFLRQFDLIILSECQTEPAIKELVTRYVEEGGNLIAFRPDQILSELFGIERIEGTVSEGFVRINPDYDLIYIVF